jgi:hypothetical protein
MAESLMQKVERGKEAKAARDPVYAQIRAIEQEAARLAPNDMGERFRLRNAMRAAAGLPPEKRKRGGLAGAWDRGDLTKIAAVLAAPLAVGALGLGGGGAAAAGSAGAGAAGAGAGAGAAGAGAAGAALPAAVPAATGLGGLLGKVTGALNSPTGQLLQKGATAAYGISQQNKANRLTDRAVETDAARWAAGAPLREQGMAGLQSFANAVPVDTSSLARLAGQGNPFAAAARPPALPAAVPAMPAMPPARPSAAPVVPKMPKGSRR